MQIGSLVLPLFIEGIHIVWPLLRSLWPLLMKVACLYVLLSGRFPYKGAHENLRPVIEQVNATVPKVLSFVHENSCSLIERINVTFPSVFLFAQPGVDSVIARFNLIAPTFNRIMGVIVRHAMNTAQVAMRIFMEIIEQILFILSGMPSDVHRLSWDVRLANLEKLVV